VSFDASCSEVSLSEGNLALALRRGRQRAPRKRIYQKWRISQSQLAPVPGTTASLHSTGACALEGGCRHGHAEREAPAVARMGDHVTHEESTAQNQVAYVRSSYSPVWRRERLSVDPLCLRGDPRGRPRRRADLQTTSIQVKDMLSLIGSPGAAIQLVLDDLPQGAPH